MNVTHLLLGKLSQYDRQTIYDRYGNHLKEWANGMGYMKCVQPSKLANVKHSMIFYNIIVKESSFRYFLRCRSFHYITFVLFGPIYRFYCRLILGRSSVQSISLGLFNSGLFTRCCIFTSQYTRWSLI